MARKNSTQMFLELKKDIDDIKKTLNRMNSDITKVKTDIWWLKWFVGVTLTAIIGIAFKVF